MEEPGFLCLPKMARTIPSFSTSMDPEHTKKMACRASPCRSRYSPGAQKDILMFSESERRQPRLADEKRDSSRISLFRCMVMSERSSSGKSFSSCSEGRSQTGSAGRGEGEGGEGAGEWGGIGGGKTIEGKEEGGRRRKGGR